MSQLAQVHVAKFCMLSENIIKAEKNASNAKIRNVLESHLK